MKKIKEFFGITFGTIIVGTAVFFFLVPSGTAVASISGLAIILAKFIPWSVSVWTLVLNILCLILGFAFVGKEFSGKTVYTSILLPIVIGVYERAFPDFTSIMGYDFLDMLCHVFLVSLGLAILFLCNASSGGIDIIVKIMNKYFNIPLGRGMIMAGMCVSIFSFFVYNIRVCILSILGTYLNGLILDHFIYDMDGRNQRNGLADQKAG